MINLRRKWYVVLFCMIIGATLLMGEKIFESKDFMIQSGNVHFEEMIEVQNPVKINHDNYQDKILYDKVFQTYAFMNSFIINTEKEFDYSKFNSNWNELKMIDKIKWLQKKMVVLNFQDGYFQIVFSLDPTEGKDIQYIKNNADVFVNLVNKEFNNELKNMDANKRMRVVNSYFLIPDIVTLSRTKIIIRYGIFGALLGCIIGLIFITIYTLRKKGHGRV